jgi:RNA polymerase sigma-70 factor, ECF subfamily
MSALAQTLAGDIPVPFGPAASMRPIHRPPHRLRVSTRAPAAEASPDAELLDLLRAGDETAYEELVRTNGGRMLAVARRLLSSEEDARDAVQEAFLQAFRALAQFESSCRLSTWLHRIVMNAALMKLRSRRRHPEGSIEELLPRFGADGHRISGDVAEGDLEDVKLEKDELRQVVRRCIARLPEHYRTVLVLRDINELSTQEASELLGLSRDAVKTRLHRARQALQKLLQVELVTHA